LNLKRRVDRSGIIGQAGQLGAGPVVGNGGGRNLDDPGDFPLGAAVLELQAQNFMDCAWITFLLVNSQATFRIKIRKVATVMPLPLARSNRFKLDRLKKIIVQFALDWVSSWRGKRKSSNRTGDEARGGVNSGPLAVRVALHAAPAERRKYTGFLCNP
jgi:hypothetical protein